MERLLGKKSPPGFRFHPTDEELFMYYLKRKVMGKSLGPQMISEVDVYRFAPWDLPALACLKTRDRNWYFFCPRAKKYPNGGRANRATECGYWKSTGNDRAATYNSRPVGKVKTLVFHRGKAPKGERTDWVMHEYRLEDQMLTEKGVSQESYVICKVFEKSGYGPKNGESYGARFVEEEWDSDTDDDNVQEGDSGLVLHATGCGRVGHNPDGSGSVLTSCAGAPSVASLVDTPLLVAAAAAAAAAATNVTSPSSTAASMGAPYVTAASMGAPCITATSVGMPNVTPASVGMPNAAAASVGSAADALTDEEMDSLLKQFTENVDDVGDIYNGLGDLVDPSTLNIDWGDVANPSAQDWGDCYIEMNDLI